MKTNLFTLILSILLSSIVSFFLSFYAPEENKAILGVGCFLALSLTLIGTVSLSFDYDKTTTLTRITSGIFSVIIFISQIIFALSESQIYPTYILITGSLVIFYALIVYGISKSEH